MDDSTNTREAADRLHSHAAELRQHAETQDEAFRNLKSVMHSAGEDLPRQGDVLRMAAAKFLAFIRQG
jgi:uncharacterized coiled-coil DUF342 family protein